MKNKLILIFLAIFGAYSLQGQNVAFSYTVTKAGSTSTVSIYAQATAGTGNNLLGFASYVFYDNTKASVASFNSSPTAVTYSWGTSNESFINHNIGVNNNIPITHTGSFFYQNLDNNFVGINLSTSTPTLLVTVTFNILSGNGGQVYLGESSQVPGLQYTDANFDGWDVVVSGTNSQFLPISLSGFDAKPVDGRHAHLTWQSELEQNFSHYEIERSTDERNWVYLTKIQGKGESNSTLNYAYTDVNALLNAPGNNLYYRLKMVDLDGSFEYSPLRKLSIVHNSDKWRVFPNPTADVLYLDIPREAPFALSVRLYHTSGQLIREQTYSADGMSLHGLPSGTYMLRVVDTTGVELYTSSVMKF